MTGVEFSRYRRLVQYFWDPEPVNDTTAQTSVWCLGKEYKNSESNSHLLGQVNSSPTASITAPNNLCQSATSPQSILSSVGTGSPRYDSGNEELAGWPPEFLIDFEAKISFTYRWGFPAIERCQNLKSIPSLSFSVRIRSQLMDGTAYTSDTGWGCMIRSGQSLLANAHILHKLGRGWYRFCVDFLIVN